MKPSIFTPPHLLSLPARLFLVPTGGKGPGGGPAQRPSAEVEVGQEDVGAWGTGPARRLHPTLAGGLGRSWFRRGRWRRGSALARTDGALPRVPPEAEGRRPGRRSGVEGPAAASGMGVLHHREPRGRALELRNAPRVPPPASHTGSARGATRAGVAWRTRLGGAS